MLMLHLLVASALVPASASAWSLSNTSDPDLPAEAEEEPMSWNVTLALAEANVSGEWASTPAAESFAHVVYADVRPKAARADSLLALRERLLGPGLEILDRTADADDINVAGADERIPLKLVGEGEGEVPHPLPPGVRNSVSIGEEVAAHPAAAPHPYDEDHATNVTANGWPIKLSAVVEGDLVLGGLMMVHEREDRVTCGPIMPQGGIQALEAMLFTLDEINRTPDLLPGITLGAHILDDCDKDTYGLEMAVDFIKDYCEGSTGQFKSEKKCLRMLS